MATNADAHSPTVTASAATTSRRGERSMHPKTVRRTRPFPGIRCASHSRLSRHDRPSPHPPGRRALHGPPDRGGRQARPQLDFFARLSEESRRRRFLGPKPKLTASDLAFLTEVDQRRHVAIVALDGAGGDRRRRPLRAWVGEPDRADIAFAVVDECTAPASAPRSATSSVTQARAAGLATLTGSTLAYNHPAKALLKRPRLPAHGHLARGRRLRARALRPARARRLADALEHPPQPRGRRAEVRGEVLLDPALVDRPHLAQQRDALVGERHLQRPPVLAGRPRAAPRPRARRGRRSGSSRSVTARPRARAR